MEWKRDRYRSRLLAVCAEIDEEETDSEILVLVALMAQIADFAKADQQVNESQAYYRPFNKGAGDHRLKSRVVGCQDVVVPERVPGKKDQESSNHEPVHHMNHAIDHKESSVGAFQFRIRMQTSPVRYPRIRKLV
jgi:hypothetical protein